MSFPVVEATAESSTNTAGTSHTVTLPASIAASDLVLITMDIGSTSATLNALTDWSELLDEAVANGLKILWYTGSGVPSNPTFTSSASTRDASISWRISGANKAIAPEIGTTATGTSATPDPPTSATPGSTKDYLFIAFAGMAGEEADDDTWGNTPPSNYTPSPPLQKSCGTAGVNLGGLILAASRQLNTGSTENPDTFGVDVSAAWRAQTIMVHPVVDTLSTPTTLALTTSAFAPTVTTTNNVRVTPSTLAHSLTTFAPTVSAPRTVTPSTLALSVSTFAPTVLLAKLATPTTAALSLSTFAPTVAAPRTVTPTTASLTLTTFAPTVIAPRLVTPATASLTLTTFAPTVTAGSSLVIVPGTASLSLSAFAPTVSAPRLATPTTKALSLSTFAPTVTVGSGVAVTPATATLILSRFAPTATTGYRLTPITTMLRTKRTTQQDFLDLLSQLLEYVAASSSLSPEDMAYLDLDEDGSFGNVDALLWLNASLRYNLGSLTNLPWSGYDPLNLASIHTNVIFVDPTDTGAVDLSVTGSNNTVTLPGGGTADLWSTDTYNYNRWHYVRTESGNSDHRIFPRTAVPVIVLFRGGSHTYDREVLIQRMSASAVDCTRIDFMSYPGELASIYNGNSETSVGSGVWRNTVMWSTTRPNLSIWNMYWYGYRGTNPSRIFATAGIWGFNRSPSPANTAAGGKMQWCWYGHMRGVDPNLVGAPTELIDSKHNVRSPAITSNSQLMGLTCTAGTCTFKENVFEFAPDNFPYVDSGDPDAQGSGDGLRIEGSSGAVPSGVVIKGNKFKGLAPHVQVILYNCDNCIIEDNEIANPAHTPLAANQLTGIGTGGHIIRYNRVGPYGTMETNSASGLEWQGPSNCQVYGNVIWTTDDCIGSPVYGGECTMHPGTDTDSHDNDYHHNLYFLGSVKWGLTNGYAASSNQFRNNRFRNNIVYGIAPNNIAHGASYGANFIVIVPGVPDGNSVDAKGCTITNNLFYRGDSTAYVHFWTSGSHQVHGLNDKGQWFTGNRVGKPSFNDADSGDFRFAYDDVAGVFLSEHLASMHLEPFDSDSDILNPLFSEVSPPYAPPRRQHLWIA